MKAENVVAFIIGIALFACFSGERGYSVRLRNTGPRQIDAARVRYGNFASDVGLLIAHAADTHLDVRESLPKSALVEWRDADGTYHREMVHVAIPQGFKGVLVFEIDGTNQVHVLTEPPPRRIVP